MTLNQAIQDLQNNEYVAAGTILRYLNELKTLRQLRPEILEVSAELDRAMKLHPTMATAHHGYAVILEELDELKHHVWVKESWRDMPEMRLEAKHVAAMGVRFMIDICGKQVTK